MRIISQCKTKSVEFCNVALLRRDEIIFARTANQDMVLAEYKTPARAAEVFEELNISASNYSTYIYYMPEK
jgi:hypothetical protein|nr:MAG TPA: hypothetical protein [Bacteriophage sp.]